MSRQKRILIIVENLPLPFDRRVWQEAQSLRDAGYGVSIICPKGRGYLKNFEEIDGIRIYRHSNRFEAKSFIGYLAEYPWAVLCELMLSFKVLIKDGFDAVQACNPPDLIFLVAAVHRLFGKKFVFDQHDLNPEMYTAMGGTNRFLLAGLKLCERLSFKLASVSIAPNESYKKVAIERGGKKEEDVFVVRSNPRIKEYQPENGKIPEELDFPGVDIRIGYVGVMGWQDSVDVLLRTAERIVKQKDRKNVQFVLIGDGPAFDSLKEQAKELGLEHNIVFTGWVPDKQRLAKLLSACDVCAVPDEVTEYSTKSTMNKTMEYMALGKALVQFENIEGRFSAQGASLYAAQNDEVDFTNKLLELIDNPQKREQMGQIGLKRIQETLNWSESEKSLLAAYSRLFEK